MANVFPTPAAAPKKIFSRPRDEARPSSPSRASSASGSGLAPMGLPRGRLLPPRSAHKHAPGRPASAGGPAISPRSRRRRAESGVQIDVHEEHVDPRLAEKAERGILDPRPND